MECADILQPAEHSRRCFRDLLTLLGVQVESFFRQPGMIAVALLGLTLILMPFAFGRLSKRLLSGARRRNDFLKSSVKS